MVRLGDGPKGLALTTDCTERYCAADPREGGKQAVAEAWRNLIAVGARPLALTDNLNFGNPERPETMGEFVGCLEGIGEAARALDFPVVSGNVSLYNETMGAGIPPTPAIGGVGVVDDVAKAASLAFKGPGEDIWLVGGAPGWLGQSAWLMTVLGREEGAPPPVDLAAERRNGEFVVVAHSSRQGQRRPRSVRRRPCGGAGRDGDGGRHRRERRGGRRLSHAVLLRRGSGPLRFDRAARRSAATIAEEAKQRNVPLSRIGVTGGDSLRLGRRGAGRSCGARRSV